MLTVAIKNMEVQDNYFINLHLCLTVAKKDDTFDRYNLLWVDKILYWLYQLLETYEACRAPLSSKIFGAGASLLDVGKETLPEVCINAAIR